MRHILVTGANKGIGLALVEAILGELADGKRGQVALLEFPNSAMDGEGFLWIDRQGADFSLRAFDLDGKEQPQWSRYCLSPDHRAEAIPAQNWSLADWPVTATSAPIMAQLPGRWCP